MKQILLLIIILALTAQPTAGTTVSQKIADSLGLELIKPESNVKKLLKQGANPNVQLDLNDADSPLMVLLNDKRFRDAKRLIKAGADLNIEVSYNTSLLMHYYKNKSYDVMDFLLGCKELNFPKSENFIKLAEDELDSAVNVLITALGECNREALSIFVKHDIDLNDKIFFEELSEIPLYFIMITSDGFNENLRENILWMYRNGFDHSQEVVLQLENLKLTISGFTMFHFSNIVANETLNPDILTFVSEVSEIPHDEISLQVDDFGIVFEFGALISSSEDITLIRTARKFSIPLNETVTYTEGSDTLLHMPALVALIDTIKPETLNELLLEDIDFTQQIIYQEKDGHHFNTNDIYQYSKESELVGKRVSAKKYIEKFADPEKLKLISAHPNWN